MLYDAVSVISDGDWRGFVNGKVNFANNQKVHVYNLKGREFQEKRRQSDLDFDADDLTKSSRPNIVLTLSK